MFLYVCKEIFRISKVRISPKVKVVTMRNLRYTIFLFEDEYNARFSYLH